MDKKWKYVLVILGSILLSWIIAMTADFGGMGLGALINLIYPILFGLITLIIYVVVIGIIKNEKTVHIIVVVLFILNIVFGLIIRFAPL